MCSQESLSLFRLRVVAEPDPSALGVVADRFRNLNVLPRRFLAEFGPNERLHIEVDVFGLSENQLALIAAKICQAPSVVDVYWHRL